MFKGSANLPFRKTSSLHPPTPQQYMSAAFTATLSILSLKNVFARLTAEKTLFPHVYGHRNTAVTCLDVFAYFSMLS